MNKSHYLAVVCGLFALGAQGQSVTILDKDGVAHKFPTDLVKEITFQPIQTGPVLEGEQLTRVLINPWGGGNIQLKLSNDNLTLDLDLYGSTNATYLEAGTYEVNSSEAPFTISNSYYTEIHYKGDVFGAESGEVIIADNEGEYTISARIVLDNGTEVKAYYVGTLPTYSSHPGEVLPLDLPSASNCSQVSIANPKDGEFRLRLNDSNWTYEMTLVVFTAPGSETIPDGVYTYSDSDEPGTLGYGSALDEYTEHISSDLRGSATFETVDGKTVITVNGILDDDREVTCRFEGTINYSK